MLVVGGIPWTKREAREEDNLASGQWIPGRGGTRSPFTVNQNLALSGEELVSYSRQPAARSRSRDPPSTGPLAHSIVCRTLAVPFNEETLAAPREGFSRSDDPPKTRTSNLLIESQLGWSPVWPALIYIESPITPDSGGPSSPNLLPINWACNRLARKLLPVSDLCGATNVA